MVPSAGWNSRPISGAKGGLVTSADAAAARMMLSRIDPLDAATAIQAAQLCRLHHLATADATILAHAQLAGVVLLTCDRHFEGIPGVEYLPKGDR